MQLQDILIYISDDINYVLLCGYYVTFIKSDLISKCPRAKTLKYLFTNRKEGNVLFNDALNTFYLRLYGVEHMVKDQSDSERGNPLPPHGLLFSISSKGSFICIIPQTG